MAQLWPLSVGIDRCQSHGSSSALHSPSSSRSRCFDLSRLVNQVGRGQSRSSYHCQNPHGLSLLAPYQDLSNSCPFSFADPHQEDLMAIIGLCIDAFFSTSAALQYHHTQISYSAFVLCCTSSIFACCSRLLRFRCSLSLLISPVLYWYHILIDSFIISLLR